MLDKYEKIGKLYDYYSILLNEKHKEVLDLYYFQDFSLSEISEILNVSRQGVHDLLKRAESNLEKFEDKLKLIDKNKIIINELNILKSNLNKEKINQDELFIIINRLIDSL